MEVLSQTPCTEPTREPQSSPRRRYERPALTEHGSVVELTRGSGGSRADGGPGGKAGFP